MEVQELAATVAPPDEVTKDLLVNPYYFKACVTDSALDEVCHSADLQEIPVSHELMLDAIQALASEDYRLSILYGAIAIETAARETWASAEERAISGAMEEASLRVITLPGGSVVRKEPILKILLEKANFNNLFHELPLYVRRRSLLVEQPNIYRNLVKLQATRNKIAHTGIPNESADNFGLNDSDAAEALQTAVDVLRWLGVGDGFVLPGGRLIQPK